MEKTELLTKYEMMVIVDATLPNDVKETAFQEVADTIKKVGGKVINSQVWLEKHKLTFPIKKKSEGTYYLINFECEGNASTKIRPMLRLNEKFLRFSIIKVD